MAFPIYSSSGAASADLLASIVNDLLPDYTEQFITLSPVMEQIVKKNGGPMAKLAPTVTRKMFNLVTKGPGVNTNLSLAGLDPLPFSNTQIAAQGYEDLPHNIWTFDVPGTELDGVALNNSNSKVQIKNILRDYPKFALAQLQQEVTRQILTGQPDGNQIGFASWNGQQTYTTRGLVKTGLFQFAAPASQTATVQGAVSEGGTNGIPGWYNQYGSISGGWSAQGIQKLRELRMKAYNEGSQGIYGSPDMAIATQGTYYNLLDNERSLNRYVSKAEFDKGPINANGGGFDEAYLFDGMKVYMDLKLDPTKFSGAPAGGLMYVLNTKTWEMFSGGAAGSLGYEKAPDAPNVFSEVAAYRLPTSYAFRFETHFKANMLCRSRRANGVLVGGDTL